MAYLLDSGILLRLANVTDPLHTVVRQAVDVLIKQEVDCFFTSQNMAEFWNVATRPVANNGLELPAVTVVQMFEKSVETICDILSEQDTLHDVYKDLLTKYNVVGKQVHDARLVAMMLTWQIDNILTLNERNFQRFAPEGITIVSPQSLVSPGP